MKNNIVNEFGRIYEQYYSSLYRYFSKNFRESEADDLCQQTFLRLWEWLPCIGQVRSEKAIIFKVAKSVLYDNYRKEQAKPEMFSLDETFAISEQGDFTNEVELNSSLNSLSERDRKIVKLKQAGYKSHEIAAIMGVSSSSVRTYISKIKEFLK